MQSQRFLKKFGLAGLAFFTLKGVAWLVIAAAGWCGVSLL
jgi:hypothetical protein